MFNNLNKGFTLTEVMITIGILGVISAIALPQFAAGIQKEKLGAQLGRTSEVLATGCQSVIDSVNETNTQTNNIYETLSATPAYILNSSTAGTLDENGTLFALGREYFNLTPLNLSSEGYADYLSDLKEANNGAVNEDFTDHFNQESYIYKNYKTGAYLGIDDRYLNSRGNNDIRYVVYVDVNGKDKPNKFGYDIFVMGLTNRCQVIPAGTQKFVGTGVNYANVLSSAGCEGNTATGFAQGLSCTARVFNNNFKIDY